MPVVFPNVGEGIALKALVNHTAPQDFVLRLYSNNITPAETDTAATYTEATGGGYAAKNLTGASWTFTEGAPSFGAYARQDWVFSAAIGNVYGYYYTQTTSGLLVASERFPDGPYPIANPNDEVRVTPRIEGD